jgi:hypothetical protein
MDVWALLGGGGEGGACGMRYNFVTNLTSTIPATTTDV